MYDCFLVAPVKQRAEQVEPFGGVGAGRKLPFPDSPVVPGRVVQQPQRHQYLRDALNAAHQVVQGLLGQPLQLAIDAVGAIDKECPPAAVGAVR